MRRLARKLKGQLRRVWAVSKPLAWLAPWGRSLAQRFPADFGSVKISRETSAPAPASKADDIGGISEVEAGKLAEMPLRV